MRHRLSLAAVAAVLLAANVPVGAQQAGSDEAGTALLHSGRRACNDGQFAVAAERFGEFLKRYPDHAEAPSANYGLALALLETANPDYAASAKHLQAAKSKGTFADKPYALQYMGLVQRELGRESLAAVPSRPAEARQLDEEARKRFDEAAKSFGEAAEGLAALARMPSDANAPLPEAVERSVRARCDQCEMLLRLGRVDDAKGVVDALRADRAVERSHCRDLAVYYAGYVKFAAGDYQAAGRALSKLAPYRQAFGPHVRYLLARAHHQGGQRPEAIAQYGEVAGDFEAQRKQAGEALKNPQTVSAAERSRLTELASGPVPEYVVRASFYGAVLLAEQGRHGEAAEKLTALLQKYAGSVLTSEAQLRLGWCQLQVKDYAAAGRTLEPLTKDDTVADRATWWLARAKLEGADPGNAEAYGQAAQAATTLLAAAAEKAKALSARDPAAKSRRGDILMDLGDAQQLARQFNQASDTYRRVIEEDPAGERIEEAMQRRIAASHFTSRYAESDAMAQEFEKRFPRSTLLAAVLFRKAANAQGMAAAMEKDPKGKDARQRDAEVRRLQGEAVRRYRRVVEEFGEYKYANAARYALAAMEYRMGRFAQAAEALAGIPDSDRTGELATASHMQADCLIRTLPAEAADALEAAELIRMAGDAAKLLEAFVTGSSTSGEAPQALLKLGYCYQRVAGVTAQATARAAVLGQAKAAYERFQQQHARHEDLPTATYERARCLELMGDVNNAINELRRFGNDPLRQSAVAPLAMARLSALSRAAGKAGDAVNTMAAARAQFEAALEQDPARRPWAAMLVYEHALAVKAAGRLSEAAEMFDTLSGQPAATAGDWAASAAWRAAQCRREDLASRTRAAGAVGRSVGRKEDPDAARKAAADALRALRRTVDTMEAQADNLLRQGGAMRTYLRLLYELAWCCRVLAEGEEQQAVERLGEQAAGKIKARAASGGGENGNGSDDGVVVPPSAVPVQPSEAAAKRHYRALIAASARGELAARARLELAELEARRGHFDSASALLLEALEKQPPTELAARIQLRLAEAAMVRGDAQAALEHARAAGGAAAGSGADEAAKIGRYLAGEAAMRDKDWGEAAKHLLPFRDNPTFQALSGVSDRAVFRLGQAFAEAGQWEQCRRSMETMRQRFPNSPWIPEAACCMGLAHESEKKYDEAVRAYEEVTRRSVAEVAAKAQFRIGLCRLAQGKNDVALRDLLAVPATYGYPEWSAAALVEAAKIGEAAKNTDEAVRLYRRVLKEVSSGPSAATAKRKLGELTGEK